MTYPARFLKSASSPATDATTSTETVDSDFVVILAALLCALICVLGLVAVARCAWIRRISGTSATQSTANKGLKKKVLRSLPKLTFSDDLSSKLVDCPICLSEFITGDEIRILPQCGHGFHVLCVDTWLGSHSSCPSCRQILAVSRCDKCGGPADNSAATGAPVIERIMEEGIGINTFLP